MMGSNSRGKMGSVKRLTIVRIHSHKDQNVGSYSWDHMVTERLAIVRITRVR
jgi:hypothetical protein